LKKLRNILAKKDNPAFWRVYGLGLLGIFEGSIFQNWRYENEGECTEAFNSLPYGFAVDWGYNDPDTLIKCAIDNNRKIIFADELVYKSGNSADQFREMVQTYVKRHELLIYDCADARMGAEFARYFNAKPVNKKSFGVSEALKMMCDYEIVIGEGSKNLAQELNNYSWHDKKSGVPIDEFNHCIDPLRYWYMTNSNEKRRGSGFRIVNPLGPSKPFSPHYFG